MTEIVKALETARARQKASVPGEPAIELPRSKLIATGKVEDGSLRVFINMKDLAESLAA